MLIFLCTCIGVLIYYRIYSLGGKYIHTYIHDKGHIKSIFVRYNSTTSGVSPDDGDLVSATCVYTGMLKMKYLRGQLLIRQ